MPSPKLPSKRQKEFCLRVDHAQVTADTTVKLLKARKAMRIDQVDYINPTGLAADNTNAFAGQIKNGSTVVGSVFNTDGDDVPAGASLAADTFVTATLGTLAARKLAAGDVLSFLLDEDGTATLPAGSFVIWFTELN